MSGEATNEIYIFFTSRAKYKTYLTKTFEFSFYYTERQKSFTTFSFDFSWIKIDDFKNQCSLVFMAVQKNIVVEKIKCV